MADEQTSGGGSAAFRCPWCSAALPASDLENCPSCGATLTSAPEAALPGVTAIDHEAILRAGREPVRQPRSRLLSWLSGEYVDDSTSPAAAEAIGPPAADVRAEILRLEIEAELADRQAEATSIIADAAVEGRPLPGLGLEGAAAAAEARDAGEAEAAAMPDAAEAPDVPDEQPEPEPPATEHASSDR